MANPQVIPNAAVGNRKARRKAGKRARKNRPIGDPQLKPSANTARRIAEAVALVRSDRRQEAEILLRAILADEPQNALAHNLLGQLLESLARNRDAYHHHKQAVTLEQSNAQYWRNFGRCLTTLDEEQAALIAYERACALRPDDIDNQLGLAGSGLNANRYQTSLAAWDRALELNPESPDAHNGKGRLLQIIGDFDGASACFIRALERDAEMVDPIYHLLQNRRSPFSDDDLFQRMERRLGAGDLRLEQRMACLFILGIISERRGDHDRAFEFYRAANDASAERWRLNREDSGAFVERTIEGFTKEAFVRLADAGLPSDRLIFIVGMPRSGTTLVETMIAAHPDATAGGEIRKLPKLAFELAGTTSETLRYPQDARLIEPARLSDIGQLYLSHIAGIVPDSALSFTDKMPTNYLHLGLIAVLFPQAKIIHCRRDPLDTCLSCYFQMFHEPAMIAQANDLANLGFIYRLYEKLMDHWRSVLPMPMLEVDYGQTVADPEAMSRQILDFVGLDWRQARRDFHNIDRDVKTASVWQVRQPIYTTSLEKWRRYEKHLGPLKSALSAEV